MPKQSAVVPSSVAAILSDLNPILEGIGSLSGFESISSTAAALSFPHVHDRASLIQFLELYRDDVLVPHELPAIMQAYAHADRCELRELMELDGRLTEEPVLEPFSGASQQVGQAQVKRLRPLRDQRLLQRYLDSLEKGDTPGTHIVVYGLVIWLYSLPLRQALLHYAQQTLHGFIESAANALEIADEERVEIWNHIVAQLPGHLEALLKKHISAAGT
jgi:urease accessory protein UreF